MQKERGEKLLTVSVIILACLGIIILLSVDVQGLLLDEGECWTFENTTVCAGNCTKVDKDACEDFIENETSEIKSDCLGFSNITDQINRTFATISSNLLDDCNKWKNGTEKWEKSYRECDVRLQSLDVNTVDEMNETLSNCNVNYNKKKNDFNDMEELYEQAQSNFYTAPLLAFFGGLAAMWFFKVRKRLNKVEIDDEGTVPSELM